MEEENLLHRQIHPSQVVKDIVSIQAFELQVGSPSFAPSSADDGQLSMYNGKIFTAEESYNHYTKTLNSAGVLSLTRDEIDSIPPLFSVDDNIPFEGHSHINFKEVTSKNQISKRAALLRDKAVNRYWTYKPKQD